MKSIARYILISYSGEKSAARFDYFDDACAAVVRLRNKFGPMFVFDRFPNRGKHMYRFDRNSIGAYKNE